LETGKEKKAILFVNKKKKKLCSLGVVAPTSPNPIVRKSSLVLFFKKERLA
jgi:hypothetical protein